MKSQHASRRRATLLGCAAFLLASAAADAAWELVPEIDIEADTNDNPRLLTDEQRAGMPIAEDTATRMLSSVSLQLATFSSRGEVTLEPAVQSDAYLDAVHEPLESTDAFFRSDGEYRWETVRAGYAVDLSNRRILGTEFLTAQPIDPDVEDPTVDSVLVGLNERRRRAVVSPYTEIELNSRASLRIDSRFIDVTYDSDSITSRTDFEDTRFGIQLNRELSSRNTVSGRVYGSRFDADVNRNVTDTTGVEIGYSRLLSDAWSFDTAVGMERSEFDYLSQAPTSEAMPAPVSGSDDNVTFALGFAKSTERGRASLGVRRSVSPDSFGFLTARNEFRAALRRQMTPRLNGGMAVRLMDTSGLGDELHVDRDHGRLELDLAWAISELWSLTSAYEYSRRTAETSADEADSSAISVGFRYRGRSRR